MGSLSSFRSKYRNSAPVTARLSALRSFSPLFSSSSYALRAAADPAVRGEGCRRSERKFVTLAQFQIVTPSPVRQKIPEHLLCEQGKSYVGESVAVASG